jgi:hypothetical protein
VNQFAADLNGDERCAVVVWQMVIVPRQCDRFPDKNRTEQPLNDAISTSHFISKAGNRSDDYLKFADRLARTGVTSHRSGALPAPGTRSFPSLGLRVRQSRRIAEPSSGAPSDVEADPAAQSPLTGTPCKTTVRPE